MGCCLIALLGLALPRATLFLMWLFGYDRMQYAIDSFLIGFIGFLLLPYTTVFWILAYSPVDGVSGFGLLVVAMGFVLDVTSHLGGGRAERERRADIRY